MILTGKAKEDFLEHIYYNEDCVHVNEKIKEEIKEEASVWLSNQDERFRNALIIEWFDEIKHPKIQIVRIIWNTWSNSTLSYKDAVIEAIKKANKIYNSK